MHRPSDGSPRPPTRRLGLADVKDYFHGAAELMMGRPDGLKRLDLTVDGFWISFSAILVAAVPSAFSWIVRERTDPASLLRTGGEPTSIYLAHALADLLAWVVPLFILMMAARSLNFSQRVLPLVIALNWGTALLAWVFSIAYLFMLALGDGPATSMLKFVVSAVNVVLVVNLASTALKEDVVLAMGVVFVLIISSLAAYDVVLTVLGLKLT